MKRLYLFCLACFPLLFAVSNAQTGFQRSFGGGNNDYGFDGKQTSDKGFVVFGYTRSFGAGSMDLYLVKTDSNGAFSWAKSYGGTGDDEGYAIRQTNDGGYILCGYTKSFGAGGYDVYLIKTNSVGDTLWTKTYGGPKNDFGNAVIQTADGGYLVAGGTLSFPAGQDTSSAFVIKTDAAGKVQWAKSYGGTTKLKAESFTVGYGVQQTSDKGYIMTGYSNGFGETNGDVILIRMDSSGSQVFTKTYGGKGVDWGSSVTQTKDGGYILAGSLGTDSTLTDNDVLLIKTDLNGDTLFTKTYSGAGYDYAQSVVQCASGYALAGSSSSFGGGGYDGFLIKTNLLGDTVFSAAYGGAADEDVNGLSLYSNGGYAMFGSCKSFGVSALSKYYLIRTDSTGNGFCNRWACPFTKRKLLTVVNTVTAQVISPACIVLPANTLVGSGGTGADACGHVDVRNMESEAGRMKLFPNPSSGIFRMTIENIAASDLNIQMTDLLGQCVFSRKIINRSAFFSEELNLQQMPEGLYLVRVIAGTEIFSEKIIIRH